MGHYTIRSTQLVLDLKAIGISCVVTSENWYDVGKTFANRKRQSLPDGRVAVACGTALLYDWEALEQEKAIEEGRWDEWWEHGNRLQAQSDMEPQAHYPEWRPL